MQALILAAGKGKRLRPLTETRPKVMLPVANKPMLQHNLEQLRGIADSAVIVVGYRGDDIRRHFGAEFAGIKLSYVEQREQLGTGHALLQAKKGLHGRFLVLMGDDIYRRADIKACLKNELAILTMQGDTRGFGACVEKGGMLADIVEKSDKPPSNLLNAGMYVLDERIFEHRFKKSSRGEYELTDAVRSLAAKAGVRCVRSVGWIPVGYPWNMLEASEAILKESGPQIHPEAEISEQAVIEGPVAIGRGAKLKNCVIRPYSCIGEGAVIGNFVEIKNSIIMAGTKIPHLSYVGDSVIGSGCNLGAGTKVANLRFDDRPVKMRIGGKVVDSGRRKLGCVMGDNVKTAINVSIMPGAVIPEGSNVKTGVVSR